MPRVLEAAADSPRKPASRVGPVSTFGAWRSPMLLLYLASVSIAQLVRFGTDQATLKSEISIYSYTLVSGMLMAAWFAALLLFRSREPRAVGTGVEEYRRVARASTALFGTIAIISSLLKLEVARGYLAVALPLGLSSLLLGRWLWRKWLGKAAI